MVSGGPAAASRIFVLKNAILTGQPVFQATLYLVEEDLARSGLAEDRAGQEVCKFDNFTLLPLLIHGPMSDVHITKYSVLGFFVLKNPKIVFDLTSN